MPLVGRSATSTGAADEPACAPVPSAPKLWFSPQHFTVEPMRAHVWPKPAATSSTFVSPATCFGVASQGARPVLAQPFVPPV